LVAVRQIPQYPKFRGKITGFWFVTSRVALLWQGIPVEGAHQSQEVGMFVLSSLQVAVKFRTPARWVQEKAATGVTDSVYCRITTPPKPLPPLPVAPAPPPPDP
jgi:hypothetical protein